MRFVYNHKEYEVLELHDVGGISWDGMLVLFEIQYVYYKGGNRILVDEEDFLAQDDHPNNPLIFEERRYVNCFPQDSLEQQEVIDNCEYFIDHEYDKNFDECKFYLMELRKAQIEFEKDFKMNNSTKGSLDRLEYAQSDLYEWVHQNIKGEEE